MIHISQFYACSKIKVPCELLYVCEIGKYLHEKYNDVLSLDGVLIPKEIVDTRYWDYFKIAITNGWVINYGDITFDESDIDNIPDRLYRNVLLVPDSFKQESYSKVSIRTPKKYEVSFAERCDDYWHWTMGGFDNKNYGVNNMALNNDRGEMTMLSLVAMVAVERQINGVPKQLLLSINDNMLLNRFTLGYVMGLLEETDALTGWCWYSIEDSVSADMTRQLNYLAWYVKGRDLGYFRQWTNGNKKYEYLCELDIEAGDIVMLYDRSKSNSKDYIKTITSCHFAKVIKLTPDDIVLELINTTKPYFHAKTVFENHTMAVKYMYCNNYPYESLNTSRRSESLSHMGVGYYLFDEMSFILPLDECDDLVSTYVTDGERDEHLLLSQNDLIYWILKDYDYSFNEERFLAKYFPDVDPVRTRYLRGEACMDVMRQEG